MTKTGLLKRVDAVTVRVPDLDAGLRFYSGALGHRLRWRNDSLGQLALELPDGKTELVLVDLSKGTYVTNATGAVTGVVRDTEG